MLLLLLACATSTDVHSGHGGCGGSQLEPEATSSGEPGGDLPGPRPVEPGREWTVAVWMDGDNDLEGMLAPDLDELERGVVPGVTFVVQIDRVEGYATNAVDDWTDTRRLEIVADAEAGVVSPVVEELGEVDMGSGDALADFLLWTAERYPSKHLAVVLWNHGGGFWIASDDTSGSTMGIADGELTAALQHVVDRRGELVDVVAFDACNMAQWENAYMLAPVARTFVASQAWVGSEGYAYDQLFTLTGADVDAVTVADQLAWSAGVYNGELTQAAVDLTRLDGLTDAIDALAGSWLAQPDVAEAFTAVRDEARGMDLLYEDFWLDLGDLAAASRRDARVEDPALRLERALGDAIIATYGSEKLPFASGLTVFADTQRSGWMERYTQAPWAVTRWDDLLVSIAEAEE